MSKFMQVYIEDQDPIVEEMMVVKFDIGSDEYVTEGLLSNIKDTLLKWLKWFKDKLVSIFNTIREMFGKLCHMFITKLKAIKKQVKAWYDKYKASSEGSKESAILTEGPTMVEKFMDATGDGRAKSTGYEMCQMHGNVSNGFEHANFQMMLRPFNATVDRLYKAALTHDNKDQQSLIRAVDNLKRDFSYYRIEVLGANCWVRTKIFTESYGEGCINKAKSVCENLIKVFGGKLTSYIDTLNNKLKTESKDLTSEQSKNIQFSTGKLSTVATYFKDHLMSLCTIYCRSIYNCCTAHEKWALINGE